MENGFGRLAIFVSFSGPGGVEKMMVNLCRELVRRGVGVDLLLVRAQGYFCEQLPPGVVVHRFRARQTRAALFELVAYLRRNRPRVLLAVKDRAGRTAWLARKISRVPTRLVLRIGTTVSAALEGKSRFRKLAWYWPMRLIYPGFDQIIAVSQGVADDLRQVARLRPELLRVVANPVLTPEMEGLAEAATGHPWADSKQEALVLGIGRLTRQKDFETLIRAFALVVRQQPARLLILGEGRERLRLERLIVALGLTDSVQLPGFCENPYAYLRRADLFVLSSRWEGSPNVLTEALGLGVPVVATDCPSGPREILRNGRVGPLVAPGAVEELGRRMAAVLSQPPDRAELPAAVAAYRVSCSVDDYLALLWPPVEK
ncbi:MAG: glycosyltransferase [Deltaproteobacteria bacterium]|nr:glycosyltransferase [Deltaproteobacteria bacterium]